MYDAHAALRVGLVERDGASGIGEDWERPGNYVLLDFPDSDGRWGCYVGKAPGGVRSRLLNHLRTKDHWRRALLIQRDITHGFNPRRSVGSKDASMTCSMPPKTPICTTATDPATKLCRHSSAPCSKPASCRSVASCVSSATNRPPPTTQVPSPQSPGHGVPAASMASRKADRRSGPAASRHISRLDQRSLARVRHHHR
jgi:hypothetical protein